MKSIFWLLVTSLLVALNLMGCEVKDKEPIDPAKIKAAVASITQTKDKEFVYENNKNYSTDIKLVKFQNGSTLIYMDQPKDYSQPRKIWMHDVVSGRSKELISNDHVYIEAAYPTIDNALVAIVSNSCGGIICSERDTSLIVQTSNGLKEYKIGDSPRKISLSINDANQLTGGIADGVYVGKDEYGTDKRVTLMFKMGSGFINPQMKPYYASLIGKFPWDYFDDAVAREPLVRKSGKNEFRKLRGAIEVSSGGVLLGGQYLVFSGCKAHFCDSSYGAIVIDTFNDDVWWTYVSDNDFTSDGTKHVKKEGIAYLNEVLAGFEVAKNISLKFDMDGELIMTKTRK